MVKVGNRVTMIYNMSQEGVVIGVVPVKMPRREYAVPVGNTWRLLIEWNDGTKTEENVADVMRLD
jgi:hypothetical protein